jgi:hypothetical protein
LSRDNAIVDAFINATCAFQNFTCVLCIVSRGATSTVGSASLSEICKPSENQPLRDGKNHSGG